MRASITFRGVPYGFDADVDSGHRKRVRRQKRTAVSFAAGNVEHAPPSREILRERIAMPVLVNDLPGNTGDEPLAGEIKR